MARVDLISGQIIGAAIRVHRKYGPGFAGVGRHGLAGRRTLGEGLGVDIHKPMTLVNGSTVRRAYVMDLLVESEVVVEVKSVRQIAPIHRAQLLTYLKLSGLQLGLIINFDVARLVDGIKRVVDNYRDTDEEEMKSGAATEETDR